MITLNLDPETKTLSVTALLKGETSPISAAIHYEVEHTESGSFVRPQSLGCSREWLELLANETLKSQPVRIAIPAGLPSVLAKVINL